MSAGVHEHRVALCGDAACVAGRLGEGTQRNPGPGLQRALLAQVQVKGLACACAHCMLPCWCRCSLLQKRRSTQWGDLEPLCSRFYFAYCEAAFDAKYIHNFQIVWGKSAQPLLEPTSSQDLPKALLGGTAAAADPFTQACPLSQYVSMSAAHCKEEEEHGDADTAEGFDGWLLTYNEHMCMCMQGSLPCSSRAEPVG